MIKHIFSILVMIVGLSILSFAQETTPEPKQTIKGISVEKVVDDPVPAENTAVQETVKALEIPAWNNELLVSTGEENFNGNTHYTYSIDLFDATMKQAEKLWKTRMKDQDAKVTNKKVLMAEGVNWPKVYEKPVNVFARFDQQSNDVIQLNLAILADGEAISPESHPEAHERIMELLKESSVNLNKAIVMDQIEVSEKTYKDLQKDLTKLIDDNKKLHQTIQKNQKNQEKAVSNESQLNADIPNKEADIDRFNENMGDSPSSDDLKELNKKRKELSKMQKKLSQLQQNQIDYKNNIREAETAIPVNENAQADKKLQIERQTQELKILHDKHDQVGN